MQIAKLCDILIQLNVKQQIMYVYLYIFHGVIENPYHWVIEN